MLRRASFGVVVGLIYLLVEGIGQVAITPLLLQMYSKEEVGLWFLVTNFLALIQLGQAGLGPVAVRALARALAYGSGEWENEIRLMGRAYRIATLFLLFLLLGIGVYISDVATRSGSQPWQLLWWSFAFGLLTRMYAWRWLNALNGMGHVGIDKVVLAGNSVLCYSSYAIAAINHSSIAMLGILYALLGIVYLGASFLAYRYFSGNPITTVTGAAVAAGDGALGSRTLKHYAVESSEFLVLNAAGFFVLNADLIIVERLFGSQVVPYFGILVKLGFLLLSAATLIQNMLYPFVAQAWASGDRARASSMYRLGLAASFGVAIVAVVLMLALAPFLIPKWLGPESYLGTAVFAVQLLFVLISVNTIANAMPALATGRAHFVDLAILSAVLAVPASWFLGSRFGIAGVAAGNAAGTLVPSLLHSLRARRVFRNVALYNMPKRFG